VRIRTNEKQEGWPTVLAVKEISLDLSARRPGEALLFASVWLLLVGAGLLAQRRGLLVGLIDSGRHDGNHDDPDAMENR
jgi:hypothetical protein